MTAPARVRSPRSVVRAGTPTAPALPAAHARAEWYRRSATCVGLGVGSWGALPLAGYPQWSTVALTGGIGCAVGTAVSGEGSRRRAQEVLDLCVALHKTVGPVDVKATRWRGGWVGEPARVRIRYRPDVDDSPRGWDAGLAEVVGRRLDTVYRVVKHDRRRRMVWLQLAPPSGPPQRRAAQVRVQRIVHELLGASSQVSVQWGDDESLTSFEVRHEVGVRVATAAQRARVERVMSAMLPGRWRARWDLEGDCVRFELRPTLPAKVDHPVAAVIEDSALKLPYAVDEDGNVIYWNLAPNAVEPHMLVVGTTGSGKTVLINGLLLEACRRGWQVFACDPKRIEFLGLRDWPNVAMVATYVESMVAVIHHLHEVMEDRYKEIENGSKTEDDFEPVFLLLDEFRNFHRQVAAWYAATKVRGMPSKCPVLEEVAAIAEKGRSAHVHLVIGTQRPDAEWLGGALRDLFKSRASLGRLSPQGAMMMWEAPNIGVAVPKNFPGRATVAGLDGHPVEAQTFWTPDPRRVRKVEDQEILDALRPTVVTHAALVVVSPVVDDLDGDGDTRPLTYYDWVDADFVPAALRPDLVVGTGGTGSRSWDTPETASSAGPDDVVEVDELDEDTPVSQDRVDGYDQPETVRVEALLPGTLVQVDAGAWAVVEACEPDVVDDGNWCIDWRDDDGEVGSLSLVDGDTVTARLPLAEEL